MARSLETRADEVRSSRTMRDTARGANITVNARQRTAAMSTATKANAVQRFVIRNSGPGAVSRSMPMRGRLTA